MRIIAGEHRSRVLAAPRGISTRPTSDRLRETLFNVLAPRVEGALFLDLYAGSGANGLEALSRGARGAVLVEQAAPALAALRANIVALRVAGRAQVWAQPVRRWLARFAASGGEPFDILFMDPPWEAADEYAGTLALVGAQAKALLAPGGVVVAEHRSAAADAPGAAYGTLTRTRVVRQGDASLSFYESCAPPPG